MNPKFNLLPEDRFFIAGHRGMVGSAIIRQLKKHGCHNIISRSHGELDLTNQQAVRDFFASQQIDHVVLAAAKVGGIHANNTYPADFIYINLMIEANVIHEAFKAGIKKLLFLGSSCIYPKLAPQPMQEKHLLTSPLESTNEPYAIAKIAGIKLCESYNRQYGTKYRAVMPTNLYGPRDNYHLENSHVLPALIRKFHLAKLAMQQDIEAIRRDAATFGPIPNSIQNFLGLKADTLPLVFEENNSEPVVEIWGTGRAYREFLHVDDMASACIFVMGLSEAALAGVSEASTDKSDISPPVFLNVGTGTDLTIAETVELVSEVVGFKGETAYNKDKPDGTPRKLMDSSKLNTLGWTPKFDLKEGLENAYSWYCEQLKNGK